MWRPEDSLQGRVLLLLCGSGGLNSGHQAWQLAEPSHRPRICLKARSSEQYFLEASVLPEDLGWGAVPGWGVPVTKKGKNYLQLV